ncbi:diacylglycerol kinase eta-like [Lytechinus variegatus]|uniref:diacylglycerol kinase eta-like n=1 Tax=Lytechinus variegatus TaxID=7654 RepID=UPI001BB17D6D|nr:diacylglycerol kinase eta-like [Lytechinus variegatus]
MKQTSSFQRWRRRYFKIKGRNLYYAKDSNSEIFEEVDLTDVSVAENSTKNVNNSFRVITPFRTLILCAYSRKEMEDWISALRSTTNRDFYEVRVVVVSAVPRLLGYLLVEVLALMMQLKSHGHAADDVNVRCLQLATARAAVIFLISQLYTSQSSAEDGGSLLLCLASDGETH